MCGIVGVISHKKVTQMLINGLKKLEYRGYDSAGVALAHGDGVKLIRSVGKVCDLEKIVNKNIVSYCGIAHTRWATHGKPSLSNTHPHISNNGEWVVVHNGIIENYSALKQDLINYGYNFYGDTDTEVIANLLEQNYKGNICDAIKKTCNALDGSYALLIINKKMPNTLYLAKHKSPLYVASTPCEVIVASDPICFDGDIKEYYSLNDGEFCEAKIGMLAFFNQNGALQKSAKKMGKLDDSYDLNGYPHFMLKEIEETGQVLKNIVKRYKKDKIFSIFNQKFIKKFNNVILIGCGTAYHSALMGANYIEAKARIRAHAYIASEFRYSNPIVDKKTLCILVSQSGETADTLAVCDLLKESGATLIALTNVEHSTITKKVNYILPTCAGREIAVASTKAYTAQIAILYMLACKLKNCIWGLRENYFKNVLKILPLTSEEINSCKQIADEITNAKTIFFIGRNKDYITATEASLKLKEISYINSASHASGELKHGFLAIVDENAYVFAIATQKNLLSKTLNGAHEALSRGGKVILVTTFNEDFGNNKNLKVVCLGLQNEDLMPLVTIQFFQYLAYFVSTNLGHNPDKPRNLAKSVTVE